MPKKTTMQSRATQDKLPGTLALDPDAKRAVLGHNAHIAHFIIDRVLQLGIVRMPTPAEAANDGPYPAIAMPRVLSKRKLVRHLHGSRYIGRQSPLGNRFEIGRDENRWQVVEQYIDDLVRILDLLARIRPLQGQDLICWCDPLPCHGHPVLRLANWPLIGSERPQPQGRRKETREAPSRCSGMQVHCGGGPAWSPSGLSARGLVQTPALHNLIPNPDPTFRGCPTRQRASQQSRRLGLPTHRPLKRTALRPQPTKQHRDGDVPEPIGPNLAAPAP